MSPWLLLAAAGLLEIGWASGFKFAFRDNHLHTLAVLLAMAGSFWLLAAAMRSIPTGTAYAVWTGIGAIGTLVVGIVAYREPFTAARVISASLIVAGIIGLKLSGGHDA